MKKSLIALAVASTFAPLAFAATSNIDISGKVAVGAESMSGLGNDAALLTNKGTHLQNYNSVITLAGNEDVGGGMKAFFSVTYGLPIGSGGKGNAEILGGSSIAPITYGGNSFVGQNQILGLEGGFGKIIMGTFDNPMKVMGRSYDLFADFAGDFRYVLSNGLTDARASNVFGYLSPTMGGFQFVLAHANALDSEAKHLANVGGAVATVGDMGILMAKGTYANGPLSLGLAYHKADTANGAATVDDEKAWRAAGSYSFGDTKVNAMWQKVDNALSFVAPAGSKSVLNPGGSLTAINSLKTRDSSGWLLGVGHKMGPITLKAQYAKYNDKAVANNDAKQVSLGADYSLSKRTTVMMAYSKVTNDNTGTKTISGGAVAGTDYVYQQGGKDPSSLAIGVKHTF